MDDENNWGMYFSGNSKTMWEILKLLPIAGGKTHKFPCCNEEGHGQFDKLIETLQKQKAGDVEPNNPPVE